MDEVNAKTNKQSLIFLPFNPQNGLIEEYKQEILHTTKYTDSLAYWLALILI